MSGLQHEGRHGEYIAKHLEGAAARLGAGTAAPSSTDDTDDTEQAELELEEENE